MYYAGSYNISMTLWCSGAHRREIICAIPIFLLLFAWLHVKLTDSNMNRLYYFIC